MAQQREQVQEQVQEQAQEQEPLGEWNLAVQRGQEREQDEQLLMDLKRKAQREPGPQGQERPMDLKQQVRPALPWAERRCWHYCCVGVG